jgi:CRISPR-associated endonuclease/helicase Cas3
VADHFTSPLILPLVEHPRTYMLLYPHQAKMLDEWENHDSFMVVSKTGTGKTASAMLPILKNRLNAIAVYPTNELIRDQVKSVTELAEKEGMKALEWVPDTLPEEYTAVEVDVLLIHIDSQRLRNWREKLRLRSNGDALQHLLGVTDRPRIVFTNPDIVFLIFALRYKSEALAGLQQYKALVFDEFHLYTSVELAHALMMVHLGRNLGAFGKVILLTATPEREAEELIERLLHPVMVVDMDAETERRQVDTRTAVHRVDLVPVHTGRQSVVDTALREVLAREKEIREKRVENPQPEYIPAVVVLSSVVNAIRFEDWLVEEGIFDRSELAIIRGLTSRDVRDTEGKLLAIGTSAIEVGVDFHCDWLIFEASEAASFMQRFGRVGRHKQGTAIILCPNNVLVGLASQPEEVTRATLENKVYSWYAHRASYSWFVKSPGGMLTTRSLIESILRRLREDFTTAEDQLRRAEETLVGFWESFATLAGTDDKLVKRTKRKFDRAAAGQRYRWINDYVMLNTFRTSLPSEWVHDEAEKERRDDRNKAKYQADITALLHRAEGLRYNEKIWNPYKDGTGGYGILTIKGYDRYKKVHVVFPESEDYESGEFLTTGEHKEIAFIQEGHKTSISHVMSLKNHIFTLVPKELRSWLDWRLPVFDCGQRLIAFDGTALLVKEIYKQSEKKV